MVAQYYNIFKTEDEMAILARTTKERGTDHQGLIKALRSIGLKTEVKNESTFEDIQYWLNKQVPVIVNWFTRGRQDYSESDVADGHYSIVVGLDDECIYIQDPEIGGMRKLQRGDFMRVWFDYKTDYITCWDDMIIRQLIAVYK